MLNVEFNIHESSACTTLFWQLLTGVRQSRSCSSQTLSHCASVQQEKITRAAKFEKWVSFCCCCCCFPFLFLFFFFPGVKILSTPTYWMLAFLLAWQMCKGRGGKKKKKALFLQALYTIHSNTVHINKHNTSPSIPGGVREKGENKTSSKTYRLSVFHTQSRPWA